MPSATTTTTTTNKQQPPFQPPPPTVQDVEIAFPRKHVLLVTLNRPAQLNALTRPMHFALSRLWDWYDEQPALRCAVLAGRGRAFCAGADLKEWDGALLLQSTGTNAGAMPAAGFGGLSNRGGKKPVLAAVDGACFGGGMEMALNCDLVVASAARARFALPEVGVGVVALAGALPRLARGVGSRQRAMEMALAGRRYTAAEMREWGVVNEVVFDDEEGKGGKKKEEGSVGGEGESGGSGGYGAVVDAALRWADLIAANSPDAVIVSREGVKLGWEGVNPEVATDILIKGWYGRIDKGENMVEGVRSFVEKRKPVWKDSKL